MKWNNLAAFLDEQCKMRGLSWREASVQAGLDTSAISRFVRGTVPSPDSCHKLAKFFGVDPDIVLVLAGHKTQIGEASTEARSQAMMLIEELLRDLPEDAQWKMLEMIQVEHKYHAQQRSDDEDQGMAKAS